MNRLAAVLFVAGLGIAPVWAQEETPAPEGDTGGFAAEPPAATEEAQPVRPRESAPSSSSESASPDIKMTPPPPSSVVESFGSSGSSSEPEERGAAVSSESGSQSEAGAKKPVPQEYQIQQGDTLWDICQKLLDNPWYWPKLWALNQYIDNPHLIYPGNRLSFFPGSETAPPKLDVIDQNAQVAPEKEIPFMPEPTEKVAKGPAQPPAGEKWETPWQKVTSIKLKSIVFLTEEEVKEAGRVTHSGETKMLLTASDHVYMKFDKSRPVAVGDRFHAIEIIKKVKDPESWLGNLGYLVKRKAVIKVICLYPDTVEGVITDGDDSIQRTDLLIPYKSPIRVVSPHDSSKVIESEIVAADHEQYLISNFDFVFLNRGRKQGIEDGMRMAAVRRGDGLALEDDKKLPYVIFGKLIVVETTENTSTAYVIDLKDSLEVGDKVVTPMPHCRQGVGVACK